MYSARVVTLIIWDTLIVRVLTYLLTIYRKDLRFSV